VRLIRHVVLVLFCAMGMAHADEASQERTIVLPAGSVHNGDYFAFGSAIEISGTVNGDVYLAGEQIVIDGTINGDVLAIGGSLDVSGEVANNVRSIGGQILISGHVGHNVTAVGGNVQFLPSAVIAGNTVVLAGNADLAARIQHDATVVASNLRISAIMGDSLLAYVGQMRITSLANIKGDVDYRSSSLAAIDPGAKIGGKLTHHPSLVHELVEGTWIQGLLVGSRIVAIMMNFLYTFVIGIILLKLFPKNLEHAIDSLKEKPWLALGFGVMLLVLLPLASLILLMTILGVPFALTLMAANIVGFYTAKIYTIFWVSNWVFSKVKMKPNRLSTLTVGMIFYFIITSIPVLGTLIAFAAMLFGLGAGVLAQARLRFLQRI